MSALTDLRDDPLTPGGGGRGGGCEGAVKERNYEFQHHLVHTFWNYFESKSVLIRKIRWHEGTYKFAHKILGSVFQEARLI
jgi:hypothetical protein